MSKRPLPPLALAYHGVRDVPTRSDPHALFVAPDALRRQIDRLRSWGYEFATFGELARRVAERDAEGVVALTFDDGFADNLETLAPLLRVEEATATVFVVSGWLGRPHPDASGTRILTADELRQLQATGIEIGAHSRTHPDLTSLDRAGARDELAGSRRELEEILGGAVDVAAYPYGRATADTVAACAEAGFRAACSAAGRGSWSEPLNLPRQDMENGSTLLGLRLKRDDRYERLMRLRAARGARRVARARR
jgi:peptidoglycan/xylan/chitin deacetylase (PgdA/CDA1 family)